MNLIEMNRALRQLRLGGMAAVLETRLRHAQAETMSHMDLNRLPHLTAPLRSVFRSSRRIKVRTAAASEFTPLCYISGGRLTCSVLNHFPKNTIAPSSK